MIKQVRMGERGFRGTLKHLDYNLGYNFISYFMSQQTELYKVLCTCKWLPLLAPTGPNI